MNHEELLTISELLICGDTHLEMDMFGHNCLNFERIATGIYCSKRFMLEERFNKTFKVLKVKLKLTRSQKQSY